MSAFPTTSLSSVCDISMGQAPRGSSYNTTKSGYPLIAGAGDFGELTPKPKHYTDAPTKLSKPGDIILCIRATIGNRNWSDTEYCLGRGVAGLTAKDADLNQAYLGHWLDHATPVLRTKGRGATFLQVSKGDIASLQIPLPPLAEQKRIAAILDTADELRTKRRQALVQLDTLVQSTFLDMFGDPVTNPMGWEQCMLGDVVHSANDGPHVSPRYVENVESGVPFLSTRHIKPGEVVWEDLKYIDQDEANRQWKKCKPEPGDILYTKGGTTGIAARVITSKPFAVWVHVALLKPNVKEVHPIWMETMLNSAYCYTQSQRYTHGIANRDLGLKRMVKIRMYLPPLAQQCDFASMAASIQHQRASQRAHLADLDTLFASLQSRAFRGDL
ncbi:MAG: restriction endonuclease subunit S [Gammaproteobacteria bacterium]|nr:restriction endonuclease subunit S [Gammaproteobacteria bacterium]